MLNSQLMELKEVELSLTGGLILNGSIPQWINPTATLNKSSQMIKKRLPSLHSVQLLVTGHKIHLSNVIQVTDYSGSSETLIHSLLTQLKSLDLLISIFLSHVMTHGSQTSSMVGYSWFGLI